MSIIHSHFWDDFVLFENVFRFSQISFHNFLCLNYFFWVFAILLMNFSILNASFFSFIFVSMFLHFVVAFLLCTFVCKTILNFIIYCFLVVYLRNLHISFGLLFLFLKMLNMSSISVRRGIYGLRCRRWLKWLLWFLSSRLPPFVVTNKPDIVLFYGTFCGQPFSGSSFLSVIRSLLFNHWLLFSKNISNFQIASFSTQELMSP